MKLKHKYLPDINSFFPRSKLHLRSLRVYPHEQSILFVLFKNTKLNISIPKGVNSRPVFLALLKAPLVSVAISFSSAIAVSTQAVGLSERELPFVSISSQVLVRPVSLL